MDGGMKRALLVVLAACGGPRAMPAPPIASAAPSQSASAVVVAPPAPPQTRDHIVAFAKSRGGLHGEPVKMPYRRFTLQGAECWLFFVGGDVAHAAWLATPWDSKWGKPSKTLPGVNAVVQAALLEDGVVFERVDKWPRAVRVISAKPTSSSVQLELESLAARDQPAGLRVAYVVEDDIGAGSMPTASPAETNRPTVNEKAATAALARAAASKSALAAALAPNATLVEVWQRAFRRDKPLVAGDLTPAMLQIAKTAAERDCDIQGACVDDQGVGVVLAQDGAHFRVSQIVSSPVAANATADATPTPVSPEEALVSFRANETAEGTPRALASVASGEKRLLVVRDDRSAYLVERDGPYSRVTNVWNQRFEKSTVEARFEDVNGDGVLDMALFARWPKQDGAPTFDNRSIATIVYRTRAISKEILQPGLAAEIDLVGARDLEDAIKRARSPVVGAVTTKSEACVVLAASTTPAGLARSSVSSARIVTFDNPMDPSSATRVVPVTRASADDAALLKDACNDGSEGGFMCRDGLCGNLDYGLGNVFRFVREGKALKLESALIYTGS
jgi:hypothetical protein